MSDLKRGRKPTPFEVNIIRFRKLVDSKSSREEIAKAIGCDTSTITKHYNEKQGIDIEFLKKYAEYFNVSADYLLGLSDTPSTDPDITMICDYTGLSAEVVEKLHNDDFQPLTVYDEESDVYSISNEGKLQIDLDELNSIRIKTGRQKSYKDQILNDLLMSREFDTILHNLFEIKMLGTYMQGKTELIRNKTFNPETLKDYGYDDMHELLIEIRTYIREARIYRFESEEIMSRIANSFSVISEEELQYLIETIRDEVKKELGSFDSKQKANLKAFFDHIKTKYGITDQEGTNDAEEE